MLDRNESEEGLIGTSEVFLGSNTFASHLYLYLKNNNKNNTQLTDITSYDFRELFYCNYS